MDTQRGAHHVKWSLLSPASSITKFHRKFPSYFFVLIYLAFIIVFVQISTVIRYQIDASFFRLTQRPSQNEIPTIWIVSHRRSGTHLTMDLLAHILPPPFRLVKTNHVYLIQSPLPSDDEAGVSCRCLDFMRRTGKIVHAYRDVRDVVTSMYYYYKTYNPNFMKDINKTEYFNNKGGQRNNVIETWINTTVPWFMEDGHVLQLPFSDAASGFEHTYDKIAYFFGYTTRRTIPSDPKSLSSPSKAVARLTGKGDHGYKIDMPSNVADEVLKTARAMHQSKWKGMKRCPRQSAFSSFLESFYNLAPIDKDGFWLGNKKEYGIFVPGYCPSVLKTAKVVLDDASNFTDVLIG